MIELKWIKFKDEKPTDGQWVLLRRYNGMTCGLSYQAGASYEATHWFPVPPDPKEDWEEAWDEFLADNGAASVRIHEAFKAGYEARRKGDS